LRPLAASICACEKSDAAVAGLPAGAAVAGAAVAVGVAAGGALVGDGLGAADATPNDESKTKRAVAVTIARKLTFIA
jgi:hypothetical protein